MPEEKNTPETASNELLNRVVKQAGIDNPKLKPTVDRWVAYMKQQAFFESSFNVNVHSFSDETLKVLEQYFQKLLDLTLFQAKSKLLKHQMKQDMLALRESIELVDGFDLDEDEHNVLPASMMVGVPNNELKDRVYQQLYQFSMVCLGKEDDAGDIDLLEKYKNWKFYSDLEVGQYIEQFEDLVKKLNDKGKDLIDNIIEYEDNAREVANNDKINVIIKVFAILTLVGKHNPNNNKSD